jgi:hypothetical protein
VSRAVFRVGTLGLLQRTYGKVCPYDAVVVTSSRIDPDSVRVLCDQGGLSHYRLIFRHRLPKQQRLAGVSVSLRFQALMTSRATRAKTKLLVEYVTVTLPVVVYIFMEALQRKEWLHFIHSPEWSIATIFLAIQAIRLFLDSVRNPAGRNIVHLLVLFLGLLILCASINTYIGLQQDDEQSVPTIVARWLFFFLSSLLFIYVAGAALYKEEV